VAALGHAWGPNKERGVFRTRDGGVTWQHVLFKSENAGAVDLSLDPHNPRVLFAAVWQARRTPYSMTSGGPDSSLWKSADGGETFVEWATPHGDNHDLWIDPANPRRMIEANDGGACVSFNGGQSWSSIYNQPTAQFYHVCADDQQPYYVYGSQQDNW